MATKVAAKLFCSNCGRAATLYAASLDPAWPLVRCSYFDHDGQEKGCGVRPGSTDAELISAHVVERRRARVTKNHHWHKSVGRPNPDCDVCRVDPPHPDVAPHEYEPHKTKYRIASHLEFVHHNRELHSRLPQRSYAELDGHHRRLHG
jgi:hypothetical protein